uniref:Uncharacterized protein n=1 Tax=Strongyloides papillosus TaxID=174720 RepID=A0A0N5BDF0_STREA
MLMKIFCLFLLFTPSTSFYTNPNDSNELKIVTLSDVIQKHIKIKAGEDIKPGLPYQTINVISNLQPNNDLYKEKKIIIYDNNINNFKLNENQKEEMITNQEQSNTIKDTFPSNFGDSKSANFKKISRRSISNAVIESAHCEHMELIECDSYETNDMKCLVTATGMPCCVCTGKLKSLRKVKKWIVW